MPKGTYLAEMMSKSVALALVELCFAEGISQAVSQ